MRLLRTLGLPALVLLGSAVDAQTWPQTRAERSNYGETSHYEDVVKFLHDLQAAGAPVSIEMIGKSVKGREIPLAIASFPPVASPAEARRLGKPIVYVQANIHAGEVEGKEAALIVLRRLCQAGPKGLLGKVVLLVTPIYNIDGNEAFGPVEENRPEQDGPAMVGLRPNGAGLDLNRDALKAESPEMSAVLAHVYTTWDPDVMMDLHTTDGTRHGYELTYSPPLNPNTAPGILKLARDEIIPNVRKRMASEDHLPLFDYGNAERRNNQRIWATFGQEGRYCTNYVGLRNRIAILSEATTFIPFKARVFVT
ncbi:MAG TPA: M14 family metallopeptidase, partial [Fimbriimonadaceae bacterium]|nr:M14 family metallopeptidase [Fimbriimonadaceae bacterium]